MDHQCNWSSLLPFWCFHVPLLKISDDLPSESPLIYLHCNPVRTVEFSDHRLLFCTTSNSACLEMFVVVNYRQYTAVIIVAYHLLQTIHTLCWETHNLQQRTVVLSMNYCKCTCIINVHVNQLFLCCLYLHFIPSISSICSLYWSSAVCRLCLLSPALYIATNVVLRSELGLVTFMSCIVSLKLPCPLSPPSFIHISCGGIAPSCQVSPSGELHCIIV